MNDRDLEDWRLNPPDYEEIPEFPDAEDCPFCGTQPYVDWDGEEWKVWCSNTHCWMNDVGSTDIESWNSRSR